MDRFCANEEDYHQRIISYMTQFPDILKLRAGLHTFVWGYEIDMHDAGRGGGNGKADLLTADEEGMVWLIEVKFGKAYENAQQTWETQLTNYGGAIRRMEWQDILGYVKTFLRWGEKTKPHFQISNSVETFVQVLGTWQNRLGRSLIPPDRLNDQIAARLRNGTYGVMVLTDFYDASYKLHGQKFCHEGPLAYVQGIPCGMGISYQVHWYKGRAVDCTVLPIPDKSRSHFVAPKPLCDPLTFADSLCKGARELWLDILRPGLMELGWHGSSTGGRGFEVKFQAGENLFPFLLIGWPESDDRTVPREEKTFGRASMRVDVHLKKIYAASKCNIDFANKWATRFFSRGWRGRQAGGMYRRWGVEPIAVDELAVKSKPQGIMQYRPQETTSCINGRTSDRERLQGLLTDLHEMLSELRSLEAETEISGSRGAP